MTARNNHGQLLPGNIANQKYEINLQLKRYFRYVKTACPSKETSNWRCISPDKVDSRLKLSKKLMNAKRRHESKLIARDNLRMFERLDQIKSDGNKFKIDNQMSNNRSLHLLNHLHGHHQKEMIRQRKLHRENILLQKYIDAVQPAYKFNAYEKDFKYHVSIMPMLSRRPISSGTMSNGKPKPNSKSSYFGSQAEQSIEIFPDLAEYARSRTADAITTHGSSLCSKEKEDVKLPPLTAPQRRRSSSIRITESDMNKSNELFSASTDVNKGAFENQEACTTTSAGGMSEEAVLNRDIESSKLFEYTLYDEEQSHQITITTYDLTTRSKNHELAHSPHSNDVPGDQASCSGVLVVGQGADDVYDTLEIPRQQLMSIAYLSKATELYRLLCNEEDMMKLSDDQSKNLLAIIKQIVKATISHDNRLRISIDLRGLTIPR